MRHDWHQAPCSSPILSYGKRGSTSLSPAPTVRTIWVRGPTYQAETSTRVGQDTAGEKEESHVEYPCSARDTRVRGEGSGVKAHQSGTRKMTLQLGSIPSSQHLRIFQVDKQGLGTTVSCTQQQPRCGGSRLRTHHCWPLNGCVSTRASCCLKTTVTKLL